MGLHIVVHPRFGDTARGTFSVQIDDELGSIELTAQWREPARQLGGEVGCGVS